MTGSQKHNQHEFCSEPLELVENYQQAEAENFKGWCIHHRREIKLDGTRVSVQELKDNGLYFHRPASELIFMRGQEHKRLHWIGNKLFFGKHHSAEARKKMSEARKGRTFSEEHRKKIAEAHKGENNPFFGKHHSEETRKKMSEARKGKHKSAEHRQKISEALKGYHHSAEARQKMSEANKGKHWWNDGVSCKYSRECPGEGWTRGRLRFK